MIYSRQEKFLETSLNINPKEFQKKIKNKSLTIIGCGGIGSPLSQLLVRGGFTNLTLVDNDIIDETNLQRQIFFKEDIGKLKTQALKEHLLKINPNSKIITYNLILDENNIEKICNKSDLIIDASDNFNTRILINNFCEKTNKDWIYNGAVKSEIMLTLFKGKEKLFNKVFPKDIKNISCCEYGVLASTTFTSASLAYNLILKYFLKEKINYLFKINLWTLETHKIKINFQE